MGIETLALAATAIGGLTSAVGAISSGQAASRNASYQAQIAQMNAKVATQNSAYEIQLGEQKSMAQQLKSRAAIGATVAAQGANNLDVNSGSNLQVQAGEAELGKLDALTIRNDASRQAYNFKTQAVSDSAQAALFQSESSQDALSGYIGAAGSLLSTAGTVGNDYLKYQMYSAPNSSGYSTNSSGQIYQGVS